LLRDSVRETVRCDDDNDDNLITIVIISYHLLPKITFTSDDYKFRHSAAISGLTAYEMASLNYAHTDYRLG
jgi:hypothetical protein